MPVSWEGSAEQVYEVAIEVKAKDREKLLTDMSWLFPRKVWPSAKPTPRPLKADGLKVIL